MTAMLFTVPKQRVLDANAQPVSGALAYFYQTGTTTPLTVYSDRARTVPHANPVVADSAGWLPAIYPPDGTYKLQLKNALGVDVWPAVDDVAGPISTSSDSGGGASDLTARTLAVGFIALWATDSIPAGWLELAGQAVSRTAYPSLFAKWGIKYGAGDGSTTFNLLDMRGETARGWDHGRGADPDAATRTDRGDGTTGDNVGTKQGAQVASHTHTPGTLGGTTGNDTPDHTHSIPSTADPGSTGTTGGGGIAQTSSAKTSGGASTRHQHPFTVTTGATAATGGNETRGRNVALVFCVLASVEEAAASALGLSGLQYRFDTTTTNAYPGAGYIRANNAVLTAATALYIAKTDASGVDNSGYMATWDDSTSDTKGVIQILKIGAANTNAFYNITGALIDRTNYYEVPVAASSATGTIITNDNVALQFARAGDRGTAGSATASPASETVAGVIEIATQTETDTGTDDVRAITPLKLKNHIPRIFASSFGVSTSNTAAANTTALNACISALNTLGGVLVLPQGTIATNALSAITGNGVTIQGAGQYAGGTVLSFANATGDCITVNGAAHFTMEECWVTASVRRTSGFAIKITGSCFMPTLREIRIDYHYDGIWMHSAAQARIDHISWRYMHGTKGVYTGGTSGGVYGLIATDLTTDNPYPTGVFGTVRAWATSTAYTANQIINVNGNIYQCSTGGTSSGAGTGPTGIPGTAAADAFTGTITDGTAVWKFVCKATLYWFYIDSFSYSVTLDNSALICGVLGVAIDDSVASGTSYPLWFNFHGLEIDHPYDTCIYALAGEGLYILDGWFGSALQGRGVYLGPSFRGEVLIGQGTRIAACWTDGVYISSGPIGVNVDGAIIYGNSVAGAGTYDGVSVAAGASKWGVRSSVIGRGPGSSGGQGYGIKVAAGASDHYTIMGNLLEGNATGGLSDGGTGINKRVYANTPSIADSTHYIGDTSFWLGLSTGNPTFNFDSNDYRQYGRTANEEYAVIGGVIQQTIGNAYFRLNGVTGTTASAANMYIDNASFNNILRSTSSIQYKQDVETLDPAIAARLIAQARPVWYRSKAAADNPDWSWYGLIAEELAEIDPRLVHWTYPPEAYETIETEGGQVQQLRADWPKDRKVPDGVQYERLAVLLLSYLQNSQQMGGVAPAPVPVAAAPVAPATQAPTIIETVADFTSPEARRAILSIIEEQHEAVAFNPDADPSLYPLLRKRAEQSSVTLAQAAAAVIDELAAVKK